MSAPKPVAGYPSRTAYCVARLSQGARAEAIAVEIERITGNRCDEKMVLDLEASHRRTVHRKIRKSCRFLADALDGDVVDQLAYYAATDPSRMHGALQKIAKDWPNA